MVNLAYSSQICDHHFKRKIKEVFIDLVAHGLTSNNGQSDFNTPKNSRANGNATVNDGQNCARKFKNVLMLKYSGTFQGYYDKTFSGWTYENFMGGGSLNFRVLE